jgi:hypothetical protein
MSLILMNNAIGRPAESAASRESTGQYGNPYFANHPAKSHKSLPA